MYFKYYGMREHPFGVTPNPHYLYLSPKHREALATLIYGVQAWRGFMALIAKPGMGKTTLLFELLERLGNSARTVFLFQTQCDSRELFHYLLSDMGINSTGQDLARMHDQVNQVLLAEARAGRSFVLIIDEAQNLADSVLETVRLLSDFETPRAKLMQIILAGQLQLAEKLARPSLVQLRQRISLLARLEPLSPEETRAYVDHRLKVAGYTGPSLFTEEAMEIIATQSKGVPRDINNICFNALSLGFALQKQKIDAAILGEVLADLDLSTLIAETSDVPQPPPVVQRPISRKAQPSAQGIAGSTREAAGLNPGTLIEDTSDVPTTPAVQRLSRDVAPAAQGSAGSAPEAADPNPGTLIEDTSDIPMTPAVQRPISWDVAPAAQGSAGSAREAADLNPGTLIEDTSDVPMTPAVQRPIFRDVQPAAQGIAGSARGVADAAERPTKGRRSAKWIAALVIVLTTVGSLVFLLKRSRFDEHFPLARTLSASNSTSPAPAAPKGLGIDNLSTVSAGPTSGHPPAQGIETAPGPSPLVKKATPRASKLEVARRPVEANTPGRKVDLRENSAHISKPEKKTTTRMAEAEPPQVRTVLPEVAIINPELSYSLQPPNEAISGPDSAEGTATAAAPRAVTRVRVGSEAQAAKLVYQPKPEYPALAKSARVQGAVRLEVVVAKDGTVEKLRVLSGHPMLVEAAEEAVERWRYEPTVLNGNPIEVVTEVDVDFAF